MKWNRGKGRKRGGREGEWEIRSALRKTCPSASLSTTNEGLSKHPNRVSLSCFVNCSTSRERIIRSETMRGFSMLQTVHNKKKLEVRLLKQALRINCKKAQSWQRRPTVMSNLYGTRALITRIHCSPAKGHVITSQVYPSDTLAHSFII